MPLLRSLGADELTRNKALASAERQRQCRFSLPKEGSDSRLPGSTALSSWKRLAHAPVALTTQYDTSGCIYQFMFSNLPPAPVGVSLASVRFAHGVFPSQMQVHTIFLVGALFGSEVWGQRINEL